MIPRACLNNDERASAAGLPNLKRLDVHLRKRVEPGLNSAEWSKTIQALSGLTCLRLQQSLKPYWDRSDQPLPLLATFPWGLTQLQDLSLIFLDFPTRFSGQALCAKVFSWLFLASLQEGLQLPCKKSAWA